MRNNLLSTLLVVVFAIVAYSVYRNYYSHVTRYPNGLIKTKLEKNVFDNKVTFEVYDTSGKLHLRSFGLINGLDTIEWTIVRFRRDTIEYKEYRKIKFGYRIVERYYPNGHLATRTEFLSGEKNGDMWLFDKSGDTLVFKRWVSDNLVFSAIKDSVSESFHHSIYPSINVISTQSDSTEINLEFTISLSEISDLVDTSQLCFHWNYVRYSDSTSLEQVVSKSCFRNNKIAIPLIKTADSTLVVGNWYSGNAHLGEHEVHVAPM